MHNFVAKIDGNVIVGKVMEKKKAEEVYEGKRGEEGRGAEREKGSKSE